MENIIIREAKSEDVDDIHRLIKELAIFEKEPEAVKISIEELREDGFGDHPSYSCIVAEDNEKIVGFALYYIRYSTWNGKTVYLEDFLVDNLYRNKGIGKILFEEMIAISKKLNVRQMSWQVLDWNEGAIRFYERYNSDMEEQWVNARLLFEKK